MSNISRFINRTGLSNDFFEPYKLTHHAVEAPIELVSSSLIDAEPFFSVKQGQCLKLQSDVFGQACEGAAPLVTIFQLQGQHWTQFVTDVRRVKGLPLGRFLSRELRTRCICIEITDDAYQSHALFDGGNTDELYLMAMNVDVKRVLTALDLELPEVYNALDPNDFDQIDEAEYSYRRDGSPAGDAEELAIRAGCYLHTPYTVEGVHRISDLRADDLVRMDVIWLENG